jgi:hypothetical protein
MGEGYPAKPATRRLSLPGDWRPAWSAGRPRLGRHGADSQQRSSRGRAPRAYRGGSAWQGFRAWRRGRPFAAGLLMILAGLELLGIPLSGVLSRGMIKMVIYIGIGGVFGILIGVLLITAGIAIWVHPVQRVFYGVAGVVLGIASFPASNLGGFFLCMLLACIGGSIAFAWTPGARPLPEPTDEELAADARAAAEPPTPPYGNRMLAVAAMPLALAGSLVAAHAATAGAPAKPADTCILGLICLGGGSSSSPSPSPSSPTPTCLPTVLPTALPTSVPTALPTILPTNLPQCVASAVGSAVPTLPVTVPVPSLPGGSLPGGVAPGASPSAPGGNAASPKAKNTTAGGGLVAPVSLSVITANSVTLSHFAYAGNAKLPTGNGGTMTMMKFTASSLTLSGNVAESIFEAGHTAVTASPEMAFNGNVILYATKLSGKLAGVPLTFTPDTVSKVLLSVASVLTSNTTISMTDVTTERATGTATSLTYGPGGLGFALTIH